MSAVTDPIDAAIESAESLISSLLSRDHGVVQVDGGASESSSTEFTDDLLRSKFQDPEQSLFSPSLDHSLITEGSAPHFPALLTATSQATVPENLFLVSPKESLHALVNKVSVTSEYESLDLHTVQGLLREREKDLEVAAKIGQTLLQRNEVLELDLAKTIEHKKSLEQQLRQLQHTMSRKEELLRLYASEQDEQQLTADNAVNPNWVQVLTEECRELRESNLQLQEEADILRKETVEVELKEKELVQQCLEQFTEAKRRLSDLREESELKQEENYSLQNKLAKMNGDLLKFEERCRHQIEECEILKEQLSLCQDQNHHLSQVVSDLQEKLDEMSSLLKEVKDENIALKDSSLHNSFSPSDVTQVEHESIVREIEEVLRKEIIAASTLPERPRSPNHYARQRTMVVMETVRAATLASSRRKERLAAKLAKPSQPLAFSSPREKSKTSFKSEVCPASPILPTSNFQQAPEELIRYRNQAFVAPEKLQIVKPLEGSVTLLKWKLLASPQLGGATSFFSNAAGPGVHMKKWRASGVIDGSQSGLTGTKLKSLSTADIDALDFSKDGWSPGNPAHKGMSASIDTVTGKQQSVPNRKSNSTVQAFSPTKSSTSLIGQVGSFLGSHFRFGTGVSTSAMSQQETQHSAGLSVLLDS